MIPTPTDNDVLITLDVDWAPDCAIEAVARQLADRGVRSTWLVTHRSPALTALAAQPELFELGVHPNFLPGSSHGDDPSAVLAHCMDLVPTARCLRTHGLVQSTRLLETVLRETPLRVDLSLMLPRATHLAPVAYPWAGQTLWRLPFLWEDDFEMQRPDPLWDAVAVLGLGPGLKIINFHPIHIALNSPSMERYETLKARHPRLEEVRAADLESLRWPGVGTAQLFRQLIDDLASSGRSQRVSDLVARVQEASP